MKINKLYFFFAVMVLIQWIAPLLMINQKNQTLKKGNEFLFKLMPVDPVDPLRGRYLDLAFEQNTFVIDGQKFYNPPTPLFAEVVQNKDGYAKIEKLHFGAQPKNTYDYIKIDQYYSFQSDTSKTTIHFTLPFSKYYVNEYDAPNLEKEYQAALRDSSKVCYGRVFVRNGHAILKEIKIK